MNNANRLAQNSCLHLPDSCNIFFLLIHSSSQPNPTFRPPRVPQIFCAPCSAMFKTCWQSPIRVWASVAQEWEYVITTPNPDAGLIHDDGSLSELGQIYMNLAGGRRLMSNETSNITVAPQYTPTIFAWHKIMLHPAIFFFRLSCPTNLEAANPLDILWHCKVC